MAKTHVNIGQNCMLLRRDVRFESVSGVDEHPTDKK